MGDDRGARRRRGIGWFRLWKHFRRAASHIRRIPFLRNQTSYLLTFYMGRNRFLLAPKEKRL